MWVCVCWNSKWPSKHVVLAVFANRGSERSIYLYSFKWAKGTPLKSMQIYRFWEKGVDIDRWTDALRDWYICIVLNEQKGPHLKLCKLFDLGDGSWSWSVNRRCSERSVYLHSFKWAKGTPFKTMQIYRFWEPVGDLVRWTKAQQDRYICIVLNGQKGLHLKLCKYIDFRRRRVILIGERSNRWTKYVQPNGRIFFIRCFN